MPWILREFNVMRFSSFVRCMREGSSESFGVSLRDALEIAGGMTLLRCMW